jgi:hypothetical protein
MTRKPSVRQSTCPHCFTLERPKESRVPFDVALDPNLEGYELLFTADSLDSYVERSNITAALAGHWTYLFVSDELPLIEDEVPPIPADEIPPPHIAYVGEGKPDRVPRYGKHFRFITHGLPWPDYPHARKNGHVEPEADGHRYAHTGLFQCLSAGIPIKVYVRRLADKVAATNEENRIDRLYHPRWHKPR